MKNNVNRKNINVDKRNIIPLWKFKQEDDTILKLALYKGAIPFDITGQTIVLGAKRPNNSVVEQTDGFTINGNEIDIALKNNILAVNGSVELDLQITDANGKLTTASFFITVAKKVLGENNLNASNDISAINQLVADLQAKTEEVNNAISTIEPKADKLMNDIKSDYNSLQKIIIDENQAANLQGQITDIGSQLDTIADKQNDILINVKDFGVLGNGTDETEKIQLAFDSIEKGQTLYFPIGDYRTRGIIFKNGDGYDIVKIKGASYQAFTESGLEDNPNGRCTCITYIGDNNGFLFDKLSTCTNGRRVIVEDILFKGSETINDIRYQQNGFIYHGRNGSVNGAYPNVYATNCKFWGFKTVGGEYQAYDNGQDGDLRTDIEQTNIYATKCQFTRNKHALSNIIDSYINKCVFNLNDVAIILRKWGFANRIIDNRIEWNKEYGIYVYQGESLIENNEFDRSGYAGLYMKKSKSSIVIGNKFLRNGAFENSTGTGGSPNLIDGLQNVHVVFNENEDCIFKGNVTREERQWDGTGDVVPNRCGVFKDNTNCIIRDNTLTGGFIKYSNPSVLNIFENNKYCLIDNIMYKNNQVTHKNYNHNFVLNANSTKYLSFDFINKVDKDSPSQIHKLTVTCFISSHMDYLNTKAHEVSYILFYKGENDNQGYIQGETTKKLGNDDTIPFEIVNFDYFRENNSIGINFKNNTSTNNNYFISFE